MSIWLCVVYFYDEENIVLPQTAITWAHRGGLYQTILRGFHHLSALHSSELCSSTDIFCSGLFKSLKLPSLSFRVTLKPASFS
ncbi:unnamed protein product [Ixodes pacificus]